MILREWGSQQPVAMGGGGGSGNKVHKKMLKIWIVK